VRYGIDTPMGIQKNNISIIIPTLNEAKNIRNTCDKVRQIGHTGELIIVDGGSTDHTPQLASPYSHVITSQRGRAIQMNTGAKLASGEILWFLHADCIPHSQSIEAIQTAMNNNSIVGGAFSYSLDASGMIYRLSELLSNYKNRIFRLFYGEMGIFVRKTVFERLGGYREIPIMEDIDLCLQLKKTGAVVILRQNILVSTRRWKTEGPVKNITRNWVLQIGWRLGISPQYLTKFYPLNIDQ
jgi:rSAM/selenodomain-associated transferase 2